MGGRVRPALALGLFVSASAISLPGFAGETITYSYDERGRLIAVDRTGSVNDGVSASYNYDKADNRTTVTVGTNQPAFSIDDVSVVEGGALQFTVTRSGLSSTTVSVTAATTTADSTATAGSDYTAVGPTVLTFAPGDASKTFTVQTIDDALSESSETVNVTLSNPTNGSILLNAQGVGTITDNDVPPPTFSINDASGVEGSTLVFTVTKTGTNSSNVTIGYETVTGTAGTGDFTMTSGTLTFSPTDTTKTISVVTKTDIKVESDEYFTVKLKNGTFTDDVGQGTIIDDGLGGGGGCTTCLTGSDPNSSSSEPPPPPDGG